MIHYYVSEIYYLLSNKIKVSLHVSVKKFHNTIFRPCFSFPLIQKSDVLLSWFLRQVRKGLKDDVEQMKLKDPNFRPGLVVLQVTSLSCSTRPLCKRFSPFSYWQAEWCFVFMQVGDRDDSNLYISMKLKAAGEVKRFFFLVMYTTVCIIIFAWLYVLVYIH